MIKTIRPVSIAHRQIHLPGSKSITHRALMMAALADGPGRIRNPLEAEDTLLTAKALEQMGVVVDWSRDSILITPPATRWSQPEVPIYLGNSGTSARLLLALVCAGAGTIALDGTARLRERPVGPAAEALQKLGAEMRWLGNRGFPPVEIRSNGLDGGEVFVDAAGSSQFLSGILMVAPTARKNTTVEWSEPTASFPYVMITLSMMKNAGIQYERVASNKVFIPAPQAYAPRDITVEGDCSSASYFWGAAALTGGTVTTSPVARDSLQGDRRFLDVLVKMGCGIEWTNEGVAVTGPKRLMPVDLDMNEMPDMVPTLGILAAFAAGTSRIRNVAHLRIKESDRIQTVATGLQSLGVPVEQMEDGLIIHGGRPLPPSRPIATFDDHRIAMAFALAGLRIEGVVIEGAECVSKSFPTFWDLFERL